MKIRKKKRLTKQELKRDPIEEKLFQFFKGVKEEPQKWGWGVLIAIVAVGIFFYIKSPKGEIDYLARRFFIQGLSLMQAGQIENAEQVFKNLQNQFPNSLSSKKSLYYLGHIALGRGDYTQAEKWFQQFLKSNPRDKFIESAVFEGLATIAFSRKEEEKMIEYIDKAYSSAPYEFQKTYYLFRKAELLKNSGNIEDALTIVKQDSVFEGTAWFNATNKIENFLKGAQIVLKEGRKNAQKNKDN